MHFRKITSWGWCFILRFGETASDGDTETLNQTGCVMLIIPIKLILIGIVLCLNCGSRRGIAAQILRLFWDTKLETAPHPSVLLLDPARPYYRASLGNLTTTDDTRLLYITPEVCF